MQNFATNKARGQIAVFAVLLTLVIVGFVSVLAETLLGNARTLRAATEQSLGLQLAESGIDKALWCLNHSALPGCTSYTGETTNQGAGSYTVNITSLGGNQDRITSTATINGQIRTITQHVATQQASDNIAFSYAVQIGAGGVEMESPSSINGSIFSNGTINAKGNAITGDATVASSITLGNSYTTQNGDYQFGKSGNITDPAQSFSPTVTATITQVSLFLKKSGSPSDKTVYLVTDNSGSPSKVSIASGTLKGSSVSASSYAWVDIPLSPTPQLTAGTRYWIVVDSSNSSSKYYILGYDTAGGNVLDVSKYSPDWNTGGTPSWTLVTGDFDYKVQFGGAAARIDKAQVGGSAQAYTIANASQIKGDAYYTVIDPQSLSWLNNYTGSPGVAYPGTLPPGPKTFSITDAIISDWKSDATAGGVYTGSCPYTIDNNVTKTIDTPLEIDCDVKLDNKSVLTINAPLWIKGNLTVKNNSAIVLASAYGTSSGVIVVDVPGSAATKGTVLLDNNVAICGSAGYNAGTKKCNPSTNGSYLMILSTYSGDEKAIDISNNADGAILFAPYGTVDVENGVSLKEVSAYTLKLEQGASVTYETGLQSVNFANGPGGAWQPASQTWQDLH